MMLEYIKCRKNMLVVILWPTLSENVDLNDVLKIIKKYGSICHIKKIIMNKIQLQNLMYWFYDDFTTQQRLEIIKRKMKYTKDSNRIIFIFLDNTNNLQLSGFASNNKTHIRNELMRLVNKNGVKVRKRYLIHINDHFCQTVYYSQIILNSNTIKMLEKQDIEAMSSESMYITDMKMQTFKKWITLNLSLLEIGRLILCNDSEHIRGTYISVNNDESQSEIELAELLNVNLYNNKTKFYFTQIEIESLKHQTTKKYDQTNVMSDPKNYYYLHGFKYYLH